MVAEGATFKDGQRNVGEAAEIGHQERLGGVGELVAKGLQACTGKDSRVVVLGHLLRGGSSTTFDRLAALRFGAAIPVLLLLSTACGGSSHSNAPLIRQFQATPARVAGDPDPGLRGRLRQRESRRPGRLHPDLERLGHPAGYRTG